jgi:hypothetical protein
VEDEELDFDNLPGDLRNKMTLLKMDNVEEVLTYDAEF